MHGLYLLWWVQEKHVPVAVVATLLAAGDLAITALEIPTGWLADRFGHRISLIAGALTQAAGMVFCWLGEGVVGLLSAILLVALGDTLRSGADQALLYRSCLALEREPDFQRIESRSRSLQLVALVAFILAGGAIVESVGLCGRLDGRGRRECRWRRHRVGDGGTSARRRCVGGRRRTRPPRTLGRRVCQR